MITMMYGLLSAVQKKCISYPKAEARALTALCVYKSSPPKTMEAAYFASVSNQKL